MENRNKLIVLSGISLNAVNKYLKESNNAFHIVNGGINYLLERWKYIIEKDLNNPEYLLEEYLNDLDGRDVIGEILKVVTQEDAEKIREVLKVMDHQFIQNTKESQCVWGTVNESRHSWNSKDQWWYYRVPNLGQFD